MEREFRRAVRQARDQRADRLPQLAPTRRGRGRLRPGRRSCAPAGSSRSPPSPELRATAPDRGVGRPTPARRPDLTAIARRRRRSQPDGPTALRFTLDRPARTGAAGARRRRRRHPRRPGTQPGGDLPRLLRARRPDDRRRPLPPPRRPAIPDRDRRAVTGWPSGRSAAARSSSPLLAAGMSALVVGDLPQRRSMADPTPPRWRRSPRTRRSGPCSASRSPSTTAGGFTVWRIGTVLAVLIGGVGDAGRHPDHPRRGGRRPVGPAARRPAHPAPTPSRGTSPCSPSSRSLPAPPSPAR